MVKIRILLLENLDDYRKLKLILFKIIHKINNNLMILFLFKILQKIHNCKLLQVEHIRKTYQYGMLFY